MKVWLYGTKRIGHPKDDIYFEVWTKKPDYDSSDFVSPLRDEEVHEVDSSWLIFRIFNIAKDLADSKLHIKLHRR